MIIIHRGFHFSCVTVNILSEPKHQLQFPISILTRNHTFKLHLTSLNWRLACGLCYWKYYVSVLGLICSSYLCTECVFKKLNSYEMNFIYTHIYSYFNCSWWTCLTCAFLIQSMTWLLMTWHHKNTVYQQTNMSPICEKWKYFLIYSVSFFLQSDMYFVHHMYSFSFNP